MTREERAECIARYAAGPDRLERALRLVPADGLQWRPAPGKWSAHEVILHCADSESHSHGRIRTLLAEREPRILGYDQDRWASELHYHELPLELALETVRAVRENTVPLLRRLTDADLERAGVHSESGRYTVADWLRNYAEHLEIHARQLERIVSAWNGR